MANENSRLYCPILNGLYHSTGGQIVLPARSNSMTFYGKLALGYFAESLDVEYALMIYIYIYIYRD